MGGWGSGWVYENGGGALPFEGGRERQYDWSLFLPFLDPVGSLSYYVQLDFLQGWEGTLHMYCWVCSDLKGLVLHVLSLLRVCFIQIIVPFKSKGLSSKSEHIYTKCYRVTPPPSSGSYLPLKSAEKNQLVSIILIVYLEATVGYFSQRM